MRISLLIVAILILSCNDNNKPGAASVDDRLPIEKRISTYFSTHPGWNSNNITEKRSEDSISSQIIPFIKDSQYREMPFKFERAEEFVDNGKKGYVAVFSFNNQAYGSDRLAYHLSAAVLAIVNEHDIDNLKQGDEYSLEGKFRKFKSDACSILTTTSGDLDYISLPTIEIDSVTIKRF